MRLPLGAKGPCIYVCVSSLVSGSAGLLGDSDAGGSELRKQLRTDSANER
jgi:hypothetical protein